jgi:hypothetical protein
MSSTLLVSTSACAHTAVDNFMHLTGKTNRTGRLDYKSFAAHMNPRLDSGGHMGDMVLERFTMMKEGFPSFLDPKDYTRRPVFRSVQSKDAEIPPQTMYTNWKGVFEALEIQVPKVTHQPRVDIQHDLSGRIMGGGSEIIEKSIGFVKNDRRKMNQNAKNHYQYKPSAHFVAGAASADPNAPG